MVSKLKSVDKIVVSVLSLFGVLALVGSIMLWMSLFKAVQVGDKAGGVSSSEVSVNKVEALEIFWQTQGIPKAAFEPGFKVVKSFCEMADIGGVGAARAYVAVEVLEFDAPVQKMLAVMLGSGVEVFCPEHSFKGR